MAVRTEVTASFHVTLAHAIAVSPGIAEHSLPGLSFAMEGAKVSIVLGDVKELGRDPSDPPEFEIGDINVFVTKAATLEKNPQEELVLPPDEEEQFDALLINAVRRVVCVVRLAANQWGLDSYNPIRSYSANYRSSANKVKTRWPEHPGFRKLPKYAQGGLSLNPADFYSELTETLWIEVESDVRHARLPAAYEELLLDAKSYRSNLRHDLATLFAAMSAELLIVAACRNLLMKHGNFEEHQLEVLLSNRRTESVLDLVNSFSSEPLVKKKELDALMKQRNDVVHRAVRTLTSTDASRAIRTVERIREALDAYL
ncbi:MAG: hypothetical protein WD533_01725 [Dehalococcoidia bacterium]